MMAGQISHPVPVAVPLRAVALLLCLFVHGCVDVNGGAVELSWKLRAKSGSTSTFLDCDFRLAPSGTITQVSEIQLEWDVDGMRNSKRWACDDDHGVTGFELPEGQALLSVSPICESGEVAAPSTFTAPAPEQRQVIAGNTISLGGVELLLEVSSCDFQTCVCQ
jgi:hypothetical protein